MRQIIGAGIAGGAGIATAHMARAHASEQGFVLLLPTDVYISAGGASVALTVILLAVLPENVARGLFRPLRLWRVKNVNIRHGSSLISMAVLLALLAAGWAGSRDPLANPLPLTIWVIWWLGMVTWEGVFGGLWRRLNPWTGAAWLLAQLGGRRRVPLSYPRQLGHWPAVAGLLAFGAFLLADPAPADPARLAAIVGAYWAGTLVLVLLFGAKWLVYAEFVTVLMRQYGGMAVLGRSNGRQGLGLPGWQWMRRGGVGLSGAIFALLLLGTGSFDGLNETFWWFGVLGLNPLEFSGRSAVIGSNLAGLIGANLLLVIAFVGALALGIRLAGGGVGLRRAVGVFAPSILPIALAYHIAHYLTSFLVDGQYVLARISAALGGPHVHVTAGFLNTPGPVRVIWLSQAGVVVIGHVVAILMAHVMALRLMQGHRRAVVSQIPLALFMVGYTVFGLWLLASPRGG
ncbi:hypothetical protein ACM25N_10895 [Roseovarius sp. C7]|uniref:hypothetical protein n=1 Tax=Roseovarius sp. C7 TaxID=3398643 RepID=UPI0039F6D292